MAGSLNQAQIIGHLGKDPESRTTGSGKLVVNFRVATSETWTDRNTNEKKEQTEWHSVVIFNETVGRVAEQYLRKGSKVFVQGKLATRKWQAQDGSDRYSTEIVLSAFDCKLTLLDRTERPAREESSYGTTRSREPDDRRQASTRGTGGFSRDLDDDIPF